MQQAGWHMDLARTSGFLIPQTLISLQKCTLTVWALGPGPHDPPVQQEEARAVSAPFPNDSGPHVAREDRQVVRHEQGIKGPKIWPINKREEHWILNPRAQVWGLAPRPQKQSPEPKSPRKLTVHFITVAKNPLLLLLSRFSHVWLCATQWTAAHQAPPSLGSSRQEHWSGLPFPSSMHESEKWEGSRSVVSDS